MFEPVKHPHAWRHGARRVLAVATLTSSVLASCAAAALAAPNPVLLGTSDRFAVLGSSAISNTPTSTINGDVGLAPAAGSFITGLSCAEVTGTIFKVDASGPLCATNDPGLLTTAQGDFRTAYANAASQTPTQVPTELAGQTLTAGVYASASGTFGMTGTVTLDGQDNLDSVFIFQTASTLITASTGNVRLTRGAQACNVFWKVGSSATLGANSTFRGTILAHEDISLEANVTVDGGRLLAGAQNTGLGAISMISDTIARPSSCLAEPVPDVVNTATGTPTPTSTTPLPVAAPLALATPARPVGTARLTAPRRSVKGPFEVSVVGTAIRRVIFFVDGKRVRTVHAKRGRKKFVATINPRGGRVHRVTAQVSFTPASGTRTITRTATVRRPQRPARPPRFTG
jgi:hypothetical protein